MRPIGEGEFGYSVALSADGTTALIGGPGDNGGATNEGAGLGMGVYPLGVHLDPAGRKAHRHGRDRKGQFGKSVSLSGDGNTALIGGSGDNSRAGAAWVFTRAGSTWTQQGEKLVGERERAGRRIRHKRCSV